MANRINLDEARVCDLYISGITIAEIAGAMGCSVEPIKRVLQSHRVRRRPAARRGGRWCGAENPSWRGGRRIRPDGYVAVWTTDGERLEHRVVMERHLERPLASHEIVHHRDGDKANNTVANLQVMTQAEHARGHIQEHLPAMLKGRGL